MKKRLWYREGEGRGAREKVGGTRRNRSFLHHLTYAVQVHIRILLFESDMLSTTACRQRVGWWVLPLT